MKKISVIIPCYNVARWIDRCMTSIVRQTVGMDVLEIICIDDASTDDTWIHLQEWERKFPENILLIRQEVNRRQGAARNVGLQYASGKWVAFVDADDWVEPDYIASLYDAAEGYGCDVACCGHEKDGSVDLTYFDKKIMCIDGEEELIIAETAEVTIDLIRYDRMGGTAWGKIIRKDLLLTERIFFLEDMACEAYYWRPMLYIYVKRACLIRKKLYHWFVNPLSISRSKDMVFCVDWITVYFIKWKEYEARGFFQEYREVLEYDLTRDAGILMAWLCECEEPSYSLYRLVRQVVTEKIPDPDSNRYFADFDGYLRCFLEVLYSPLDKSGFQQFYENIKQMKQLLKRL